MNYLRGWDLQLDKLSDMHFSLIRSRVMRNFASKPRVKTRDMFLLKLEVFSSSLSVSRFYILIGILLNGHIEVILYPSSRKTHF